jgi:hypothetical protein
MALTLSYRGRAAGRREMSIGFNGQTPALDHLVHDESGQSATRLALHSMAWRGITCRVPSKSSTGVHDTAIAATEDGTRIKIWAIQDARIPEPFLGFKIILARILIPINTETRGSTKKDRRRHWHVPVAIQSIIISVTVCPATVLSHWGKLIASPIQCPKGPFGLPPTVPDSYHDLSGGREPSIAFPNFDTPAGFDPHGWLQSKE